MLLKRFVTVLLIVISALFLYSSQVPPGDPIEQVRFYTRQIEFDYVTWTMDAMGGKLMQSALGASGYLNPAQQENLVREYLRLVDDILHHEAKLTELYASPNIQDREIQVAATRQELNGLLSRQRLETPLAEEVLQDQISAVLGDLGLTAGGQAIPPVLFHNSPLPMALIVSPRNVIREDADISLLPDLEVDEMDALEKQVDSNLNVSSLVVPVGGIGIYPTMVMRTTDLDWLTEVVSHEWTHNYLTLRPLGVSYFNSPELRTMNETTASISGKEIGLAVLKRYYPELVPPEQAPAQPPVQSNSAPLAQEPPKFDYRAEMHETRVTVDKLLADGKIEEAESYMEERRVFMWEHGYQIRKLNQAYFAFYGAYADQPGGTAGEDPVGPAVRELRQRSSSLVDFLNRISWMSSFAELQQAVR